MKEQTFKFHINRNDNAEFISIGAKYPNYIYPLKIKKHSPLNEKEQIQLAVSELKIKLMQEIINAEIEL